MMTMVMMLQEISDNRGVYEDDLEEEKLRAIKAILGEGKAHYTSLIEQLIFMVSTLTCYINSW